jgi:large subunit ribosomal protein L9
MLASKGTLKQAEVMQRARAERAEKEKDEAAGRVALFAASPVYISARAGEEGRLFGSVTKQDIARAIEDQLEQAVDRHLIRLEEPIRSLGTHQVEIHLHEEVNAMVTVEVIAHEEDAPQA